MNNRDFPTRLNVPRVRLTVATPEPETAPQSAGAPRGAPRGNGLNCGLLAARAAPPAGGPHRPVSQSGRRGGEKEPGRVGLPTPAPPPHSLPGPPRRAPGSSSARPGRWTATPPLPPHSPGAGDARRAGSASPLGGSSAALPFLQHAGGPGALCLFLSLGPTASRRKLPPLRGLCSLGRAR